MTRKEDDCVQKKRGLRTGTHEFRSKIITENIVKDNDNMVMVDEIKH